MASTDTLSYRGGMTEIGRHRLRYRAPFDWTAHLTFLAARAVPGVEHVDGTAYRRTSHSSQGPTCVEVRQARRGSALEVRSTTAAAADELSARVARLFDTTANPTAVVEALGDTPLVGRSVREHPGLRVPGAWDPFEIVVRAIVGQQISVKGAATMLGRIARTFGTRVAEDDPSMTHVFPGADRLVDAQLERVGLTRARAGTIRGAAAALLDGRLAFDVDTDTFVRRFTALRGIGPWTAQYVAMRALADRDAFPCGDLGLRKAAGVDTDAALATLADAWRPYRAYAALHLWRRLATPQSAGRSS
ncbi:MAG: AlkA N-terminal domain-containing protein [Vicinamibacterales bacterium]